MKKRTAVGTRARSSAKAARSHAKPVAATVALADSDERPLHRSVENALNAYFAALDGETTCGLYDLVMVEVERPMLECVMRYVADNQCRAAALLGVSRGTLRKKLIRHGLLES
jgi:Fis family transcriptional regulator, factor for inversion stimulation protein